MRQLYVARKTWQRITNPLWCLKVMVLHRRLELRSPGYESGASPSTLAEYGSERRSALKLSRNGAGEETRTPVTGLEGQGTCRCTTPACLTYIFNCQRSSWSGNPESNRDHMFPRHGCDRQGDCRYRSTVPRKNKKAPRILRSRGLNS